jgi:tetratricopeptide (TPR) repeat protein
MYKFTILLILLSLLSYNSEAQNTKIDSLRIVLNTPPVADTTKIKISNILSWEYALLGDYEAGIKSSSDALIIINTLKPSTFLLNEKGKAFINIGIMHYYKGDYNKAQEFYLRALPILEEINDKRGMGSVYNNIGLVYDDKGEYTKALEFFLKALRIREELGDKKGIASSYGNIGGIHYSKGDYTKALEFHLKAVKIRQEMGDEKNLASSFNNIGIIYDDKGDYPKALEYHLKSVAIKEKLGDKKGLALSLGNMGNTYQHIGNFEKALEFFSRSLKIKEEIGDKRGMASAYHNIGLLNLKMGNIKEAKIYQEKSYNIAYAIASRPDLIKAYEGLSIIDSAMGDFKSAYKHHKQYTILKDSVFNEESSKKVVQSEMNFEFEKKEQAARLEQEKKDALAKELLERQTLQRNGFIGGFVLMLAFAGVTYRSYRNKRKSHEIIERQKELVEERNRDISDSINYAKRLQQAILPSERSFTENLENSFILYKPKDIVAGDFYWMEKKGDVVFVAAADCTGHGVPGAMISVVCSNALNRTVKEFGITEPGKILDKVRELVIETFEKSESEVKDGMDISLCAIDINTREVMWAGANNSLWYLMNNEIKEIKPDKQPIGKHEFPKPFTTHHLHLSKGDILYLFTDGYADQFGGEKGKKFKYSKFKELLLNVSEKSMTEQKQLVEEAFNSWKGTLDQIDDVCVIGIRI